MNSNLSPAQCDLLANFTLDIAKGLLLGSVGIAITGNFQDRILVSLTGAAISFVLVRMGLNLANYD